MSTPLEYDHQRQDKVVETRLSHLKKIVKTLDTDHHWRLDASSKATTQRTWNRHRPAIQTPSSYANEHLLRQELHNEETWFPAMTNNNFDDKPTHRRRPGETRLGFHPVNCWTTTTATALATPSTRWVAPSVPPSSARRNARQGFHPNCSQTKIAVCLGLAPARSGTPIGSQWTQGPESRRCAADFQAAPRRRPPRR